MTAHVAQELDLPRDTIDRERKDVKTSMFRRPLFWFALVVVAIALAIATDVWWRQRTHAKNMAKAEAFKREFDAQLSAGASLAAVDEYLKGKPVTATRSLGYANGRDYVKELLIEVANERSVHWYCGRTSVGVKAAFSKDQLTGTETTWWSFDCL